MNNCAIAIVHQVIGDNEIIGHHRKFIHRNQLPGDRQRGSTCIKVDTAFWLYQAGGQFANRRFLRRRQFGFDLMRGFVRHASR